MTTIVFFRTPLSEPIPFPARGRTDAPPPPCGPQLGPHPGPHPGPGRSSIRATIREGWRRWRSRTALSELDPHILKDIGVTRAEAEYEANKPFWRA